LKAGSQRENRFNKPKPRIILKNNDKIHLSIQNNQISKSSMLTKK